MIRNKRDFPPSFNDWRCKKGMKLIESLDRSVNSNNTREKPVQLSIKLEPLFFSETSRFFSSATTMSSLMASLIVSSFQLMSI